MRISNQVKVIKKSVSVAATVEKKIVDVLPQNCLACPNELVRSFCFD